mgnify:CR=1 FL=1
MLLNLKELTPVEGVNYRTNCPYCGGINTFSMMRTGGSVTFNCFRASCSGHSRGVKIYSRTAEDVKSTRTRENEESKKFIIPDYFEFGLRNEKCINLLRDKYSWEAYEKGYFKAGYDPREDRLIFFLFEGNTISGAVGRALSKAVQPKSKLYQHSGGVFRAGIGSTAVLVEDCFSAASVARSDRFTGISLNGTNLTKIHLTTLREYDKILVALDKDATRKSVKLNDYLNFMGCKSQIWRLEKDFKDCPKIVVD